MGLGFGVYSNDAGGKMNFSVRKKIGEETIRGRKKKYIAEFMALMPQSNHPMYGNCKLYTSWP